MSQIAALIRARLGERAFWVIQVMIVGVSVLHVALEAGWITEGAAGTVDGLHHLPVVLYLVPVAYASLEYGLEGGILTSLWAGALASLNILLFGISDYEWLVDLGFVVLVVAVGIITAIPVERERRERRRAEAAVRRLEILNELADIAVSPGSPADAAALVLDRIVEVADLDEAAFALWRGEDGEPVISHGSEMLLSDARKSDVPPRGTVVVPVEAGDLQGILVAVGGARDDESEVASFLSAVGSQLVTRVENAILLDQEQQAWSTYVRLVTEAQEEERRRLARELHDGPAQQMAMLVRALEERRDLHDAGSRILAELRRVARDQRPTLLDDLGVTAALEWLVEENRREDSPSIEMRIEGEAERLTAESEVVLYRVAQEAIRNAETHGRPSRIEVLIRFEPDDVYLSVSDDGIGFEAPQLPRGYLGAGRLGLMGMYERAQLVGGSLSIRSGPNQGTQVLLSVPRDPRKTATGAEASSHQRRTGHIDASPEG